MMKYGLSDSDIEVICCVLANHIQIAQAILYGSRAMGNHRPGSDIDLTLLGSELNSNILWRVSEALEESSLPYKFDLSLYDELSHEGLIDHIRRVGIEFYNQASARRSASASVKTSTELPIQ